MEPGRIVKLLALKQRSNRAKVEVSGQTQPITLSFILKWIAALRHLPAARMPALLRLAQRLTTHLFTHN